MRLSKAALDKGGTHMARTKEVPALESWIALNSNARKDGPSKATGLVLLVLAALAAPITALADWPTLGRLISAAPGDQRFPKIVTDGAAGAIIVWQDSLSTKVNVFARRALASGELDPAWPIDGRALLADSVALAGAFGGQQFPVIATDGAGGAIVAWQDARNQANGLDIFAQHVLASGIVDPAWPANGRALCGAVGRQERPAIVSDGAGGAIVTWMDERSAITDVDIFAQHVLASGVIDPRWPVDGLALSKAPEAQAAPQIASDGSGGAIVTWHDFRPSQTGVDVYAQRVLNSGVVDPAWPGDGRALSLAAGAQVNPTIVSDGAHGAIVTWEDSRDALNHIFAQRVLGSGQIAAGWPANGLAVCTAAVDQVSPVLTSDGASGAIIAWMDARSGLTHDIFAQHVLGSGTVDTAWPVNGTALSLSSGEEVNPSIVGDGVGGALVAWEDDFFVKVNHVQATGLLDPEFPVNGQFVRLLLTFQQRPDLTVSGTGNAIVAWSDLDSGADSDIYALLVTTDAQVDVDPGTQASTVRFARLSSNPARGSVTFGFSLPREAAVRLAIYDLNGRQVRQLASETRPAGDHAIMWDLRDEGGRAVGAGLYLARLEAEGNSLTQKIATLE